MIYYVPTATREELYEAIQSEPDLFSRFNYSISNLNAHPLELLRERVESWIMDKPDII